jgi:hypothetical protein
MKKHRKTKVIGTGVLLLVISGLFFVFFWEGDDRASSTSKELPAYAKINRQTAFAYAYALENPQILEKIPCYCGCYVPVAMHGGFEHKNNKNCFIKDDGSWVKHGSECDVCVYTALDVKNWLKEGMSIKQARDGIDSKYGRSGAPPTRTPPLDENGDFVLG